MRINNLKMLLNIKDDDNNELLELLLEKAESYIKMYTQRSKISDSFNNIILDIAVIFYNRLGSEGEISRSVGISQTFESEFIPKHIEKQLNRYRLVKIASVVYEK